MKKWLKYSHFLYFNFLQMSKKIIFSSALVATSLFLTSCGNAQLGTFQDEMKDEQRSYAKNIDEYISKLE